MLQTFGSEPEMVTKDFMKKYDFSKLDPKNSEKHKSGFSPDLEKAVFSMGTTGITVSYTGSVNKKSSGYEVNIIVNYQIYDSFSNPADSYDIKGMPKVDWGRPYNIKSNVRTFNLKETYKTTDEIKNAMVGQIIKGIGN